MVLTPTAIVARIVGKPQRDGHSRNLHKEGCEACGKKPAQWYGDVDMKLCKGCYSEAKYLYKHPEKGPWDE